MQEHSPAPPTGERTDALTAVAVVYDFDGTLAPGNMQDRRFIPDLGLAPQEFWDRVVRHTAAHRCDPTLSYMQVMLNEAAARGRPVHRSEMERLGTDTEFYPGVAGWFPRLNEYATMRRVELRHYVISSGNSEIIESTSVAGELNGIFASRFAYDSGGRAIYPAEAVNFTTKTQYLFRINKGAFRPGGEELPDGVNTHMPESEKLHPFPQMVYIGDGETDIPCFRVVSDQGGLAVAVHDEGHAADTQAFLREGRVSATALKDYRQGQKLDLLLQAFVDLCAARARLTAIAAIAAR